MNPILATGADPWITRDGSDYLLTYTAPSQGHIEIRRARSLTSMEAASPATVWTPPPVGELSKEIWAPELHRIDGRWHIYFAADDGDNANHRMFVLRAKTDDPLGEYELLGSIKDPANDRWAIDGTILELRGERYLVWSGWPGSVNAVQNLYIAKMKDPVTLESERVLISTPELDWEWWINEGPQVLQRGGRTFVIYSANGSWTDNYRLGLLSLEGDDPLDPKSWHKHPSPVFSSVEAPDGVYAPGHCSFTTSPDGKESWIVYHSAKHKGAGWDREVRAQRFDWDESGAPVFGSPARARCALQKPSGDR